jgi:tetratricopeptide (TPR) repeat protein
LVPLQPEAEFTRAAEHQRRGDLAAAEQACRRTLEMAPRHFGAHYLLGIIALQRRELDDAETRIGLALSIDPNVASAQRHHGVVRMQLGRLHEALTSFTKAIALKPDDAETFQLRAIALHQLGRFEDSLADYDRAVELKPAFAGAYNNRGIALHHLGRLERALASIDHALALSPDYAAAHKNRGDVLRSLDRFAEALSSYDRAIVLNAEAPDAFYGRGLVLQDLGRPLDAIASYDQAIARDPKFAPALNNRGNVLKDLGRPEDALSSYDAAVGAAAGLEEAWYNRGIVLLELKRPHDALASYDRAIAIRPDYPEALVARGLCKLAMGLFDTGWRDFEHRWQVKSHPPLRAPTDAPLWTGEDPAGRSILVCSERGLGDVIQFSRYIPLLSQRGARVTFLVPASLRRLLDSLPATVRVTSEVAASDRFDFHCALLSLPHRLGTAERDLPLAIPYLAVDAERAAQWREQIGGHGFKIGICWQGAAWQGGAPITGRAIPLPAFHTLSRIDSVRLISLQKEQGIEQLAQLPPGMTVETLGDDFDAGPDAFADTAAVMQHLDLIVTCDTSIAHVAGGLGRPTWIALQNVPEWRWMLEGETSPWYPTVRLFRQRTRGDWAGVFNEMASELRTLVASTGRSRR